MSALQDAASAFATALATALKNGSVTLPPEVQTHLNTIDTEVAALQTNEAGDAANIADVAAAVTTITSALTPTPAPAPAPSSSSGSGAA